MFAKRLSILCIGLFLLVQAAPARAMAPVTYYVSFASGNDDNSGTLPTKPLKTLQAVNDLELNPGDKVLLACGETWRADPLIITRSGTSGSPITFSSNPPGCTNKPRLLGTYPVSGWTRSSGNIYVATLNAGTFPNGINQVFRNGKRLTMGRWPNLGAFDNGYSTVDVQPSRERLTDYQLPAGNWVGATIHLKVIRWSMINRDIIAMNGTTMTLNNRDSSNNFVGTDCWDGSCAGWGYFINNSLATLDQEGEWYYDKGARRLYLYTAQAPSATEIEASVVLRNDDRNFGAVNLGPDMGVQIAHVVVDNLEIRGWYDHGIASPTNLHPSENSYITLSNNAIYDVDDSGIDLWTWVYDATDGRPSGWRGGNNITIQGNLIDGANSFGIHTPSRETIIQSNIIRNIALIPNLNEAGMGCGKLGSEGSCTESGAGLRIYVDQPNDSGHSFFVNRNRFENIGAGGIQTFGANSTFSENVFDHTCISKGDCGAINTYGGNVHDITVTSNIIIDTIGNTDGCRSDFKTLFGFGLYYDNSSRNVVSNNNTIIRSTAAGILYQNSTGSAANNTIYNNAGAFQWGTQVVLAESSTRLNSLTGNIFFIDNSSVSHLSMNNLSQLGTSDQNRFYHKWRADYISADGSKTLAQWKSYSGKDGSSVAGTLSKQRMYWIYVNDTPSAKSFTFDTTMYDLDGNALPGGLTLQPFTSKILSFVSMRSYLPAVSR